LRCLLFGGLLTAKRFLAHRPVRTDGTTGINELIATGLLASGTPKGSVSLCFPTEAQENAVSALVSRNLKGLNPASRHHALTSWKYYIFIKGGLS
jgi:hypothetical protein